MENTTTVYVFEHASGYDWFYSREDMEAEFESYRSAGWLGEGDGMYSIPVPFTTPLYSFAAMEEGNAYFIDEDFLAMTGCVTLWRFEEAHAESEEHVRMRMDTQRTLGDQEAR